MVPILIKNQSIALSTHNNALYGAWVDIVMASYILIFVNIGSQYVLVILHLFLVFPQEAPFIVLVNV